MDISTLKNRLFTGEIKLPKKIVIIGISCISLALLCLCCFFMSVIGSLSPKRDAAISINQLSQPLATIVVSDNIVFTPTITLVPSNTPIPQYKVTKVVDGDTVDVDIAGTVSRIRLIGIDTPELNNSNNLRDCFSTEATSKMSELVLNKYVILESDLTQGDKDKYDRLLRYIFLPDQTNINKKMISDGYAFEYTYNTQYKYRAEFKLAETQAKSSKIGLWSSTTCNGNVVTSSMLIPTLMVEDTQKTTYTCNCKKTCANMDCDEAQYQLKVCGCSARDGDKDGLACDSQCQ
jgi:micrococcal nuclease